MGKTVAPASPISEERLSEIHNWHFTEVVTGKEVAPQNLTGKHLWELLREVRRQNAQVARLHGLIEGMEHEAKCFYLQVSKTYPQVSESKCNCIKSKVNHREVLCDHRKGFTEYCGPCGRVDSE